MLDNLIDAYQRRYDRILDDFQTLEETGVFPHADVEGAPKTVEEAKFALASMMFAVQQILTDLNVLRMEQRLGTVGTPGDTGTDA